MTTIVTEKKARTITEPSRAPIRPLPPTSRPQSTTAIAPAAAVGTAAPRNNRASMACMAFLKKSCRSDDAGARHRVLSCRVGSHVNGVGHHAHHPALPLFVKAITSSRPTHEPVFGTGETSVFADLL